MYTAKRINSELMRKCGKEFPRGNNFNEKLQCDSEKELHISRMFSCPSTHFFSWGDENLITVFRGKFHRESLSWKTCSIEGGQNSHWDEFPMRYLLQHRLSLPLKIPGESWPLCPHGIYIWGVPSLKGEKWSS